MTQVPSVPWRSCGGGEGVGAAGPGRPIPGCLARCYGLGPGGLLVGGPSGRRRCGCTSRARPAGRASKVEAAAAIARARARTRAPPPSPTSRFPFPSTLPTRLRPSPSPTRPGFPPPGVPARRQRHRRRLLCRLSHTQNHEPTASDTNHEPDGQRMGDGASERRRESAIGEGGRASEQRSERAGKRASGAHE